ncbi:MAG: DNA primase [Candidatus Competibacter denitrificans]
MSADRLLNQLDKVKSTGLGRWLACCPAHEDRHPSLAIRELDDGRVLLHCFTGCDVAAVLAAVGLEFSDLYPDKLPTEPHHRAPERSPFSAKDVLRALAHEVLIVDCAAGTIQHRGYLNDREADRLGLASDRIAGGLAYSGLYD